MPGTRLNRSRGRGGERAERVNGKGQQEDSGLSQDRWVQPHARQELSMSDNSISLLRQRMIEDMTARRFKEKVRKDCVRHVRTFTEFLGRSPDKATSEDLRRFQLHMAQQQIGAPAPPNDDGIVPAIVAPRKPKTLRD